MFIDFFTTDNLPTPGFTLFFLLFILIVRFLRILSCNEKPIVIQKVGEKLTNSEKLKTVKLNEILKKCSILEKKYVPPMIWGRNGHLQTIVYGILGHALLKRTYDKRYFIKLETDEKTTFTFDIFEPTNPHYNGEDCTLILCPGIANSSESNYIRTCVHYAQENGYRCAVLNHLGALTNVKLTSNFIFTYGGTAELHAMVKTISLKYKNTRFMFVGFSMGANIITRFISEIDEKFQKRVLLGISVCQGYNVKAACSYYHDWECGRRIYNYLITENMKRLLRRNYSCAIAPHSKNNIIDEKKIWSCTSILALDEYYSRRVHGYKTVEEYYYSCSCLPLIPNIKTPIIFINALDDPLIPEQLWRPVQEICKNSNNEHVFILLKHGGHLGFLEGGSFKPNSISWLDRFIIQIANSATANS